MASRATLGLLRRPNTTYVLISQRRACAALSLSSRHTLSLHTLCTQFIRQQANTSRKPCERFTRSFTTSQTENGVAETFPDPDRPDLFYHLFTPPTPLSSTHPVYALSFLSSPPSSIMSASVIGWLPASGEGEGAGLNDFVENEAFREVLHQAIQSALHDGADEVQRNGAVQIREGWMHIHDNRNVPALGRIGDPDDIIASVRVENGEILADTYQPMPSYRLCTADGVLQLTDGLAARLVELLETRSKEERT